MTLQSQLVSVGTRTRAAGNTPPIETGRPWAKKQTRLRLLAQPVWSLGIAMLAAVATDLCRAVESPASDKAARIDELISWYQQCGYLNGAVLVAEHGKVIYSTGVGLADMATHQPNTPQTRFGIASITKQFTAVLVLQQVEKGKLRLEGTVSEYLPWYRKDTGQQITIEQLLHHTSGLPADYDSPEFSDSAEACRHYEPLVFAQKFCQPNLVGQPGTKWTYSNGGYVLLGLILEHVTGKSFDTLLHEQILAPLGLNNTGLLRGELPNQAHATGYTRHAGPRYTVGPHLDMDHIFSAGAMYSSVEDLHLWNQALSSERFLSADLQKQVFQPGLNNWGYGWFVTKIAPGTPGAGATLAEMRGDMPGNFFAWMLRYPGQDGAIIVLRNGYGSTEHLEEQLQAILFNQQPRLPARSPKDVLAHAWWVSYGVLAEHRVLALLSTLLLLAGALHHWSRRWIPQAQSS